MQFHGAICGENKMPVTSIGIEKYIATITTSNVYHAMISLYSYNTKPPLSATLYFIRDGVTVQGNVPSVQVSNTVSVFHKQSAYRDILDLLRNESPVFIHYDPTFVQISTSMEPVGESE
jgi:hypothetical protein